MSEIAFDYSNSAEKEAFLQAENGALDLIGLLDSANRLSSSGAANEAEQLYRLWISVHSKSPHCYVACFNLAVIIAEQKRYDEAVALYKQALDIKKDFVKARLNMGTVFEASGKPEDAIRQWRLALEVKSITKEEKIHALSQLGRLLESERRFEEALEHLKHGFSIDTTQWSVLYHMVFLSMKICSWPFYSPIKGISKQEMIEATSPLAMLAVTDDPALQLKAAQNFVREKFANLNPEPMAPKNGYGHKKIRIGYVSADFRAHAVSLLTVELMELHNRDQVEVYGFCWSNIDGSYIQDRMFKAMDHHIRIDGMSDEEAARCIREHEIDIAVDLHGMTASARSPILAYRPAPLQVTYLGFPGTVGLPWIDFVISDKFLIPEELAPFHTEKPLYMPNCFQVSDRQRPVAPASSVSRTECGLPEKGFVFCAFNNNYKYTPEMFDVWMNLLKRVPGSVLWLLDDNKWAKKNLTAEARKRGVNKNRLIFAGRVSPETYLARYRLADLFLDTFPFNGGTTANDALFMRLPIVTLTGRTFASRMAGSLLTHLELPELVTYDYKQYEETACRLALHPAELKVIKERLNFSAENGPVFDTPRFAADLEAALKHALAVKTGEAIETPAEAASESAVNRKEAQELIVFTAEPGSADDLASSFSTVVYEDEQYAEFDIYKAAEHFVHKLSDTAYIGIFSSDFTQKTGLQFSEVRNFMGPLNHDVYTFSPLPDISAFFLNVFEQLEVFEPGFQECCQEILKGIGFDAVLKGSVMDSRHIVFNSFFAAKKEFWIEWLDLCRKITSFCETSEAESIVQFRRSPRKRFFIERTASLLLRFGNWSVKPYNMFSLPWSTLGTNQYKSEAVLSDALKTAHNDVGSPEYLTQFGEIRGRVFFNQ